MESHSKDALARSHSWAVIRHVERSASERKGSVFDDDQSQVVPIQDAQSYKPDKSSESSAVVRRLVETLTEQQPPTAARHSAASLKVHFRCSLDDISNDNEHNDDHDDDPSLSFNDGLNVDCSYRSQSGNFYFFFHDSLLSNFVQQSCLTGVICGEVVSYRVNFSVPIARMKGVHAMGRLLLESRTKRQEIYLKLVFFSIAFFFRQKFSPFPIFAPFQICFVEINFFFLQVVSLMPSDRQVRFPHRESPARHARSILATVCNICSSTCPLKVGIRTCLHIPYFYLARRHEYFIYK